MAWRSRPAFVAVATVVSLACCCVQATHAKQLGRYDFQGSASDRSVGSGSSTDGTRSLSLAQNQDRGAKSRSLSVASLTSGSMEAAASALLAWAPPNSNSEWFLASPLQRGVVDGAAFEVPSTQPVAPIQKLPPLASSPRVPPAVEGGACVPPCDLEGIKAVEPCLPPGCSEDFVSLRTAEVLAAEDAARASVEREAAEERVRRTQEQLSSLQDDRIRLAEELGRLEERVEQASIEQERVMAANVAQARVDAATQIWDVQKAAAEQLFEERVTAIKQAAELGTQTTTTAAREAVTVSPQEQPAVSAVSPQEQPTVSIVSPQEQPAVSAVSPQEQPTVSIVSPQEQPAVSAVSPQEQPTVSTVSPQEQPAVPTMVPLAQ
eukprot:TRINITY_DN2829_c0_g1_i2.p1 TRINITY_DN2829_c0_g1~~TRINITY_DN2829_c0_g1_i2.p1  ORF type:complete len:378 (+),score=69.51 TRINITY_DN2829_c0_g1_i2:208-1341(+)